MTSLLYGFNDASLLTVAKSIEASMKLKLECSDSGYRGGEYFAFEDETAQSVYVQNNRDMDELAEEEFPKFQKLIYVDWIDNVDCWKVLFETAPFDCTLLRAEEF